MSRTQRNKLLDRSGELRIADCRLPIDDLKSRRPVNADVRPRFCMTPKRKLLLCVVATLLSACNRTGTSSYVPTTRATPQAPQIVDVTMKQLLDHPKDYDDKTIRVVGFVYLEFEGNIICAGPDSKYSRPIRHIWLDVDEPTRANHARYHQKYVLVEGTLNGRKFGHMNLSAATIENITRFELTDRKAS